MSKSEILHLIDVGNTRATYAAAKSGRLGPVKSVLFNEIPQIIINSAKKGVKARHKVLISSVVPKNTQKIKSDLYAWGLSNVLEIGQDLIVPLKHKYKNGAKLGVDRKIDAYGAISSHKLPCLVFDFGTALTCDLIDRKGVFLGGLIIPGPESSLRSLLDRAALLPKLFKLKTDAGKPYGRNTNDCIQKGVIYAYAAMTDGLIAKLSKELGGKPHVIITGGFAPFIGKIIQSKAKIDPSHTLRSMLHLYTQTVS